MAKIYFTQFLTDQKLDFTHFNFVLKIRDRNMIGHTVANSYNSVYTSSNKQINVSLLGLQTHVFQLPTLSCPIELRSLAHKVGCFFFLTNYFCYKVKQS
jgi:hypothetical protein